MSSKSEMRSPRPAPPKRSSRPPRAPREASVELQLAIGPRGLGIELSRPASLGPLLVTELSVALPQVRFPIDVSGGVRRFRHRRGSLERATVELSLRELSRFWAPKLAGVVGAKTPDLHVALRPYGAAVAIVDDESARLVAFDVALLAEGSDLLVVAFSPRALGVPTPAVAGALTALMALLGPRAERRGSLFRIPNAFGRIARELLPEAGARAPAAEHMRAAALTPSKDVWILQGFRDAVEPEHPSAAVRALELAEHLGDADDALAAGDALRARVLYLHALSKLPRHPEVGGRVADLDRTIAGREEAARALLDDSPSEPATVWVLAELLERVGDLAAARRAFAAAAELETLPVVSAFGLARAAGLPGPLLESASLLDRAIAKAPTHPDPRRRRAQARLALGRLRDAIADVEEIEALARGHRQKHAVWMRAADAWIAAGHTGEARALYERALKFVPDDPPAVAGLGSALFAAGQKARGMQLLVRAFSLPGSKRPHDGHRLVLAEALSDVVGDDAAAVARLAEIADVSPEAALARGLEGRLRAKLGDAAGASVAFARLRDATLSSDVPKRYEDRVVALLREAARFEEGRDPALALTFDAAIAKLAPRELGRTVPPAAPATDDGDDEARAEELLARFRERPADFQVVEALATVLSRLGRTHELLAVLSGCLEDAPPNVRDRLAPVHRNVLTRLEREARERGHDREAQLFRDALVAFGGAIEP